MTTATIANHPDTVSEVKLSTGPATTDLIFPEEIFLGSDVARARQAVPRLVLDGGVKPGESMTTTTLLARVAKWRKAQARVHCVYELRKRLWAQRCQLREGGS